MSIENHKIFILSSLGIISIFLLILGIFNPKEYSIFPPCIFNAVTGLQCSGCGSLRGIHELLNGNFTSAFSYNPLTFLFTLPILCQSCIQMILSKKWQTRIPNYFSSTMRTNFFIVVLIGYGVIRNIAWVNQEWLKWRLSVINPPFNKHLSIY